jgi:hypothetical protein
MPALIRTFATFDNAVCSLFGLAVVKNYLVAFTHPMMSLISVASWLADPLTMCFLIYSSRENPPDSCSRKRSVFSPSLSKKSFVLVKEHECGSPARAFHIQVDKVGGVPVRNKRPR